MRTAATSAFTPLLGMTKVDVTELSDDLLLVKISELAPSVDLQAGPGWQESAELVC